MTSAKGRDSSRPGTCGSTSLQTAPRPDTTESHTPPYRHCHFAKSFNAHCVISNLCEGECSFAGKVRVTVVPRLTSLAIATVPPCRSVMDLTRARPRPVPCELRDESTR